MTPEDKQFLDDNRHYHDTWMKAQTITNLDHGTKDRIMKIVAQYFIPGYSSVLWCGDCVIEMIKVCYREYDKYLVAQDRILLESRTVSMTFPKHDQSVL